MSTLLMPTAGPAAHKLSADTLGLAQRGEADATPGAFAQALRRSSDAMQAPAAPAATRAQASPAGAQRRQTASEPTPADAPAGTGPGTGAGADTSASTNASANGTASAGEPSETDDAGDSPRTRGRAGARRVGGDSRRAASDHLDARGALRADDSDALPGRDDTANALASDADADAGTGTDADPAAQDGPGSPASAGLPVNPVDTAGRQAHGLPGGGHAITGAGSPSGLAGGLPPVSDAAGTGGSAPRAPEATAGLPATNDEARPPAGAAGPGTGAADPLTAARPERTAQGLATTQRWRSADAGTASGAAAGALPVKAGATAQAPGVPGSSSLRSAGAVPGARTAGLQLPGKLAGATDPVGNGRPAERAGNDPGQVDAVAAGTPTAVAATADPSQADLLNGQPPTALASQVDNGQHASAGTQAPGAPATPSGPAGLFAMPVAAGTAPPSPPGVPAGAGGRAAATGIEPASQPAAAPAAAALLRAAGDGARADGPGQRASNLRRGDADAGPGQRSTRATEGSASDALVRDPAGLAAAAKAAGPDTGARGEGAGTGQSGTGATNNAGAANTGPVTGPRGTESFQALLAAAGPAAPAFGPPAAPSTAGPLPSVWLAMPMHSPEFSPALGAQITMLARDGVQEARIELNPAEMGPITVRIAIQAGGAQVDFQAEQAATRQVIEASLPNLAGALRDAGLTLTGGGVFEPPPPAPADAGFSPASGQGQTAQSGGGHADDGRGGTRQGLAGRLAGDGGGPDRGSTTVLQPGPIRGLVDLVA